MEAKIEWLEEDAPSLSCCHECRFRSGITCSAYPSGVPYRWLHGFGKHSAVQDDQVGTLTFQSVESPQKA